MRCRETQNRFVFAVLFRFWSTSYRGDCSGLSLSYGDRLITLEGGEARSILTMPTTTWGLSTGEIGKRMALFRFPYRYANSSIIEFTIDPVEDGEIDHDFSMTMHTDLAITSGSRPLQLRPGFFQ